MRSNRRMLDHRQVLLGTALGILWLCGISAADQPMRPAPDCRPGEGCGPFKTLAIKDALLIDHSGAPIRGPVNITIKSNRIEKIGGDMPKDADHVIDASSMYVLPGFVDMHAYGGSSPKTPEAEFIYKLWMTHGVTTVRGVPLADNEWTVSEKARSERNEIVAPRIFNYQRPPPDIRAPEEARRWVESAASRGIDGLLGPYPSDIMHALLDESRRVRLGSTAYLGQLGVANMNALDAARLGLGTVFDPTLGIYAASRDVMRARKPDWHDRYTLPSLMAVFEPSRANHGSYCFYWTKTGEVAWRNFYQVWFRLLNDYKKMGGRVTTGSDAGFIFKNYRFGFIKELELLQEAGFHPLEVIQCATMNGALTLFEPRREPIQFGIVRPSLPADLIIVGENPLQNLKVLYGTGAVKLDDATGKPTRVGGIVWTIKDGIVYDAKKLLEDVAEMVSQQKEALRKRPLNENAPLDRKLN